VLQIDYLLCLFVIKLILLLNSSDSDAEVSERLHQLADDLPDQGAVIE